MYGGISVETVMDRTDHQDQGPVLENLQATGVGKNTLWELCNYDIVSPKKIRNKSKPVMDKVDTFDRGVIRRVIQSF